MNTMRFFQNLSGSWIINRSISNFGRVQGEATFKSIEAEANTLAYYEKGWLTLEGSQKALECHKEYLYRYQPEQDIISVHFVESETTDRLFHTLKFSEKKTISTAADTHLCVQDTYKVRYESIDEDTFKIIYDVSGPKKGYVSDTSFQRKSSATAENFDALA